MASVLPSPLRCSGEAQVEGREDEHSRRETDVPHHPKTGMATVDWTKQTREEGRSEALVQNEYQCMANVNVSFSYVR